MMNYIKPGLNYKWKFEDTKESIRIVCLLYILDSQCCWQCRLYNIFYLWRLYEVWKPNMWMGYNKAKVNERKKWLWILMTTLTMYNPKHRSAKFTNISDICHRSPVHVAKRGTSCVHKTSGQGVSLSLDLNCQ